MSTPFRWLLAGALWLLPIIALAQTSLTTPPDFASADSARREAYLLEKSIAGRVTSYTAYRRSSRKQVVVGKGKVAADVRRERVIFREKIKQLDSGLLMRTLWLTERVYDANQRKRIKTYRLAYFNDRLAYARFYDSRGIRRVVVNNRYYR